MTTNGERESWTVET